MAENEQSYQTIDEYIALQAPETQEKLNILRQAIREAAPEAKEKISWQMPTFDFHGNLVHFALCKHHIGFYPGADGVEAFQAELADYATTKGGIQLPLAKPLPLDLVTRIVRYRVQANLEQAQAKAAKRRA